MEKLDKSTILIKITYFGLYLVIGISLLVKQPFGSPPDEFNRFLIPQYIAENGTLPNGYEESIRISGYGFSYGFQPILPYMVQGYAMKFMALFTDSETTLLYTARSVNLIFGLLTAWIVLLLSERWFRDRHFGWLFAFLTTFLPQSIFVHTYVNTDSCCMLSIAIMLYGLTFGLEDGFSRRTSCIMAVGIILCALSYYNAYGYILSCIFLFTASFLSVTDHRLCFDYKNFIRKGCFISAIVLIGIAWWFIRSAILYDGDFLGLRARDECAALYALPEYHPDTRITWQNQGYSLWDMIKDSDFMTLSVLSFIGIYGPMAIITSIWVYRFYKILFALGLFLCAVIQPSVIKNITHKSCAIQSAPQSISEDQKTDENHSIYGSQLTYGNQQCRKHKGLWIFYHINMIFCMVIPLALSLVYSYATDYQPQGRYLLPALFPLCFYTIRGLEKMWNLTGGASVKKDHCLTWLVCLLCIIISGMLALTVYGYAFPYYEANPIP